MHFPKCYKCLQRSDSCEEKRRRMFTCQCCPPVTWWWRRSGGAEIAETCRHTPTLTCCTDSSRPTPAPETASCLPGSWPQSDWRDRPLLLPTLLSQWSAPDEKIFHIVTGDHDQYLENVSPEPRLMQHQLSPALCHASSVDGNTGVVTKVSDTHILDYQTAVHSHWVSWTTMLNITLSQTDVYWPMTEVCSLMMYFMLATLATGLELMLARILPPLTHLSSDWSVVVNTSSDWSVIIKYCALIGQLFYMLCSDWSVVFWLVPDSRTGAALHLTLQAHVDCRTRSHLIMTHPGQGFTSKVFRLNLSPRLICQSLRLVTRDLPTIFLLLKTVKYFLLVSPVPGTTSSW